MTTTATKTQPEARPEVVDQRALPQALLHDSRAWQAERLQLLWGRRRFFCQVTAIGLIVSTLVAVLIPSRYTSTTQLMPPDPQTASGMAMLTALAAKAGSGLGGFAGDLLGLKTSGALFVGILQSQTAQDRLVQQFDLRAVYGKRLMMDARLKLSENTAISEDRKSGIISISVTDRSPQRAAALGTAYVDQLNGLVAELSTSAAHRQRVFLEERLKVAKQDLDDASNQLAQFSSKNNTLDIQTEGKAMLDAAANIGGQMIAAQAQLEGLRQIYTDSNPRVRSMNARVLELRREMEKLGGKKEQESTTVAARSTYSADMPYPSIRNLPLLGAEYANYYRRAKIQETVYELLTGQYELAKIEEAKETPSVKVLDPARVPEKKSFPPRFAIIFVGTFLALGVSVAWVLGSARWEEVDPQDPRKIFLQEVAGTLRANANWSRWNGDNSGAQGEKAWDRFDQQPPSEPPEQ